MVDGQNMWGKIYKLIPLLESKNLLP